MSGNWTRRDLLAAAAALPAAAPSGIDLFRSGEAGYAACRIPGIVLTASGTLLAYCEARKDAKGDWGDIDIRMRRSTDGGRTWSAARTLVDIRGAVERNPAAVRQNLARVGEGAAANNPVAIADAKPGRVHFLYCVDYGRCYYRRSADDGDSYGPAADITPAFEEFRRDYEWKVLATGPGHGIQLSSGRLLVPVWLSTGEGGHAHRPSAVATIYSDDGGERWRRGDIVVAHGGEFVNPSESAAAQLSDGRVMLNIRSESKAAQRAVAVSPDGATHWTRPRFDRALYEPVCMAGLVRVPGRRTLVFVNPDSRHVVREPGSWRGSRQNLAAKISEDGGQTWVRSIPLDAGPSGYADLAAAPDGTIYCLYERGAAAGDQMAPARLTLIRFALPPGRS